MGALFYRVVHSGGVIIEKGGEEDRHNNEDLAARYAPSLKGERDEK